MIFRLLAGSDVDNAGLDGQDQSTCACGFCMAIIITIRRKFAILPRTVPSACTCREQSCFSVIADCVPRLESGHSVSDRRQRGKAFVGNGDNQLGVIMLPAWTMGIWARDSLHGRREAPETDYAADE